MIRPPSVDALMRLPELSAYPERLRAKAARRVIARHPLQKQNGKMPGLDELCKEVLWELEKLAQVSLREAINASGVILHTGLGRARLAEAATKAVQNVAAGHSILELDEESGKRGDRQEHVHGMLCELTGAEDAFVVNNCASAVVLTLSALCSGKEVVLSRGQMVEIGGSFRMPEIVTQSGCQLVEVGCTNKTRLTDYERAFGENTGAILRCHRSNFALVGFWEEPGGNELAALSKKHELLFIDDAGSGCLLDTTRFGLPKEQTLSETLQTGADVVLASGDKLLGGPQAGLILGRTRLIDRIKEHPLARAVRIDKLCLAGLEATLRLYSEGRELEIPIWRYASCPLDQVKKMALRLRRAWPGQAVLEKGLTEIGGGSLPGAGVPTWRVGLVSSSPEQLLGALRTQQPAIIGRIERNLVWLDPRTLEPHELRTAEKVFKAWEN